MEKNRNLSPYRHSEVGPNFVIMGFRGKIAVLRHLEWFLVKSEESRPPLKWPILGGLLSSLFSKNPSKCVKKAISLKISTFSHFRGKIAVLRHLEGFLEKMSESRPPLKLKNNGGLLSEIFSENHSKCLKMEISLKF